MLFENWYFQILGLVPEVLGFVTLSTALAKERISFKKMCIASLIICVVLFTLFHLPIKYGVHITIGVIVLILVLRLLFKLSFIKSAIASILAFIILLCIESILIFIYRYIVGLPLSLFSESEEYIRFLLALPSVIILLITGIAAQYRLHKKHAALTDNVGETCQ